MSGKFDFMLSYLESVAMYLDTVDWKDLKISQDEFLARLTKAGIPEAELQLDVVKEGTAVADTHQKDKGESSGGQLVDLIDGSTLEDTILLSPVRPDEMMHGNNPHHKNDDDSLGQRRETFNSVQSLIEEGTPLVLHEESEGLLQQKFPWIYANAGDLRVGEVAQLLSDYRDLVLQHEALKLALRDHLPIVSDASALKSTKVEQPNRMASVSDAAGSLMQKLSLYGWKRDQNPAGQQQQPTLLHSIFGRPHPHQLDVTRAAEATPTSGLSPVVGVDNTPTVILDNSSHQNVDANEGSLI